MGRLWVEVWALLVACDRLVVGVLLSVWLWLWLWLWLVGAVAGGVGGLVGDVVLLGLGLGGLLLWVTHMVVVGGIVAAVGASLGW